MIGNTGVLLFAALGGYLVLERAQKQKSSVRFAGRLVGWVVILAGLLGSFCQMQCMSQRMCATKPCCPISGKHFRQGGWRLPNYALPPEEQTPAMPAEPPSDQQ